VAVFPLDKVLHSGGGVEGSAADNAFDFTIGLVFGVFGSCCCFLLLVLDCSGDEAEARGVVWDGEKGLLFKEVFGV